MRLAIVSRAGQVLAAYRQFFEDRGFTLTCVPSLSKLFSLLQETAVSGFVVDIHMVVKATDAEKNLLRTMEGIFPNVRTNWSPATGFRALYSDGRKTGEENLVAFLEDCRRVKPRALRRDMRQGKKFNVLFWMADASQEKAQRAFTMDISRGGLFVCTSDPPPEGSVVSVSLQEVDPRPFKVLVKWRVAWGIAMRAPGFGGSFVGPDAELVAKLEATLAMKG